MAGKKLARGSSVDSALPDNESFGVFKASYLGAATVVDISTANVINEAYMFIRSSGPADTKVFLLLTREQVKVVGRETTIPLQNVNLDQIAMCALSPSDRRIFGYVVKTRTTGVFECHVFVLKEKTTELIKAFSDALAQLPAQTPPSSSSSSSSNAAKSNGARRKSTAPDSSQVTPSALEHSTNPLGVQWTVSFEAAYVGSHPGTLYLLLG